MRSTITKEENIGYTRFGEMLRILRIQNHEVMGDLAEVLHVSTPFLSSVESGKKNIPDEWFDILSDHYNLSEEDKTRLKEAMELSKTQMKINLSGAENYQREMAIQFQRSFNYIDEETARRIIDILNNKEDD